MRKIISLMIAVCLITTSIEVFAEEVTLQVLTEEMVQTTEVLEDDLFGQSTEEPGFEEEINVITEPKEAVDAEDKADSENMEMAENFVVESSGNNVEDFNVIQTENLIEEYPQDEDFSDVETNRFIIRDSQGIQFIQLDEVVNAQQYIEQLKENNADILYIQPDYKLQLNSVSDGWAFHNKGVVGMAEINTEKQKDIRPHKLTYKDYNFEAGLKDIKKYADGKGSVVAVIDTAMDIEHEQIAGHIYQNEAENTDGTDSDSNGYIDDINGWDFVHNINSVCVLNDKYDAWHATSIAGIITEIAPETKILPLKVFENGQAYTSDIIRAIDYCRKQGIHVVNCSFSGKERNLLLKEIMKSCSDILFVCAAGNDGVNLEEEPVYPAGYYMDNILTVASVNEMGELSSFSNYSAANVDIAAPGENIITSMTENQYGETSGTSVSAAFVSASAALLYDKNFTPLQTKEQMSAYGFNIYKLQDAVCKGRSLNVCNLFEQKINNQYLYFTTKSLATKSLFDAKENVLQNTGSFVSEKTDGNISGWQNAGQMTSSRSYMSSIVYNDNIYVFGGQEDNVIVNKVEMYDTQSGTWTTKASMPNGRYKHSALELNGKVYICAGYTDDGESEVIDVYDIVSDTWETAIETPNRNTNYAAAAYADLLYIFGGKEDKINTTKSYQYDVATGTWLQLKAAPKTLIDEKTVMSKDSIRVFADREILEYNITKKTWNTLDCLPKKIYDYAVINRPQNINYGDKNTIYITGGKNWQGEALKDVKVRYNYNECPGGELSPEWYNDLRLPQETVCHNMVVANGYVYILGGQGKNSIDQDIIFKRALTDPIDDVPDIGTFLPDGYIYGSINDGSEEDTYVYTPTESGYHQLTPLPPIESNREYVWWNVTISSEGKDIFWGVFMQDIGAIFMEAEKTYTIKIHDVEGAYAGNYMYQMRRVFDDIPDDISGAIPIQLNQPTQKSFYGAYDKDYMYIDISKEGQYELSIFTDPQGIGASIAKIALYDNEQNKIIEFQNDYSHNSKNEFCYLTAGRYYIMVSPYLYHMYYPDYVIEIQKGDTNSALYIPIAKHSITDINDIIYVLGGIDSQFQESSVVSNYNTITQKSSKQTNINISRKGASAVGMDNKIYLVGGYDDGLYFNNIEICPPTLNGWISNCSLKTKRERAAVATDGRQVYIAGGRNADGYISTMEICDDHSHAITEVQMPEAVVDASLVWVDDGLYLSGGVNTSGYSDKLYKYKDGAWVEKCSIPYQPEQIKSAAYSDGFISVMIVDGQMRILYYNVQLDEWVEQENRFTNSVTQDTLTKDIFYYDIEVVNDALYLMGGIDGDIVLDDIYTMDLTQIKKRNDLSSGTTIDVAQNQTYSVVVNVSNINSFLYKQFTLTYNPEILEIEDCCAQTWSKDLAVGPVDGTNIAVISNTSGKLIFTVFQQISGQNEYSGAINIVRFKGKRSGNADIVVKMPAKE